MAQVRDFLMPDLGEGLTEGEILSWLVAEGDTVDVDQPVVEVSTEKAAVVVPTPFAGRVAKLHGAPGDIMKVGTPLISIESDGGSGNVLVGYGTSSEPARRRPRAAGAAAVAAADEARPAAAVWPPASPVVRRLAAQRGIDLAAVTGTGPGGMVTRADLDRASTAPAPDGAPQPAQAPGTAAVADARHRLIGIERIAAERLTRSHQEIPTAMATTSADATALLRLRAGLEWAGGGRVTPFALLLRLVVVALHRYPRLNAHFDAATNEVVPHQSVHLGVAVQTERGLVVPVIRGAERLTPLQLAVELERLAAAARAGTLPAADLSGSTFTVSNFGAFGVDGGAALINPPEVAILGVGRIAERPWVVGGQVEPRHVVQLSLVFDHRVADGAVGGGYLKCLADLIEQPETAKDD